LIRGGGMLAHRGFQIKNEVFKDSASANAQKALSIKCFKGTKIFSQKWRKSPRGNYKARRLW
jgi:hypothetical protein